MRTMNRIAIATLMLAWMAAQAMAGNVFVLPANVFDTNLAVFTESPFQSATNLTMPAGIKSVIAKPDGSQFFVFTSDDQETIVVVKGDLTGVVERISLGAAVRTAALSPDGRRLYVLANTLRVFDATAEDNPEITHATASAAGTNPTDVAFTLDSAWAYVLNSGAGQVVKFDVVNNVAADSFEITGTSTGLSVAPNGLIWVSAANAIYVIDPAAGAVTRQIDVNGLPGKGAFTPNARYAFFPNSAAFIATGLGFLVDTQTYTRTVLDRTGSVPELVLDHVAAVDELTFYAVSTTTRQLVKIPVDPFRAVTNGFLLATTSDVRAMTVSKQIPQASYIFVATGNGIIRGRFATSEIVERTLTTSPGRLQVAGAASTAAPTGGFYKFNDDQRVAGGATTKPLILRVYDANGLPVFGKMVSFSTAAEGVTFAPESAVTSADGFALTTVTVPETAGVITVRAAVQDLETPIIFSVTVEGETPGSAGTGLVMYSGNGQVVPRGFSTEKPMRVRLTDSTGKPMVGATVTWELATGAGLVSPKTSLTDDNGIAESKYIGATLVPASTSWVEATVTASVVNYSPITFTMITVPSLLSGTPAKPRYTLVTPSAYALITGQAGQTLPGAVVVTVKALSGTKSGQGIPNVGVEIESDLDPAENPSAACVAPGGAALTDATGTATCNLRFGGVVGGPVAVTILAGGGGDSGAGSQYTALIKVDPGPPGQIKILGGNNQAGSPGALLPTPLTAEISDEFGHLLPNVPVTWESLTPTTVSIVTSGNVTNEQGRVSATVRLGSVGGPAQVRLTAGSVQVVFDLTVVIPVASLVKVSGDGQSAILNQPFAAPLVVEARNAAGAPVAGVTVNFAVVSGSATIGTPAVTTGTDGRASTTVTAGGATGPVVIRASAGEHTATFNLTVGIPVASLTKISGDNQTAVTGQSFSSPLVVEVRDGAGAPVSGAVIAFTVTSGSATLGSASATSGADGRASTTVTAGATTGTGVVRATSFSYNVNFTLTVVPVGPNVTRQNIRSAISGDMGVTPGGMTAIYGDGIAPSISGTVVANGGTLLGPLPTTLAGVTVTFGSTPAPIYYVSNSSGQQWVVVQAPFTLTAGSTTSVTVTANGGSTTVTGVEVKPYQPAIFETLGPAGQRWAVLPKAAGNYVTPDNPVRRGVDTTLRMYVAGIGQATPALSTNSVGVPDQTVLAQLSIYALTTDGSAVTVVSAKPMEGVVGVYVLTLQLPAAMETGNDKVLILGVAGTGGPFTYSVASTIPKIE